MTGEAPGWPLVGTRALLSATARHLRGRDGYLMVLAHMRSGSTVLAHILGSHPDIAAVGETHHPYRRPADLIRLAYTLMRLRNLGRLPRWALEKALDVGQVHASVLADRRVRVVLLTRRPGPAVASALTDVPDAFGPGIDPADLEARAFRYLLTRYGELAAAGRLLGERAFALDYQDLVEAPDATLAVLTAWLGLDPPLTRHYVVDAFTGRPGLGDPSAEIKTGWFDPTIRPPLVPPSGPLDVRSLARAEVAYAALRGALAGCVSPSSGHPFGRP